MSMCMRVAARHIYSRWNRHRHHHHHHHHINIIIIIIIIIAYVFNVAAPLHCASSQVLSLKFQRSSRRALHETVFRRWLLRPRSQSLFREYENRFKVSLEYRGCRHCCQEYQRLYLIQRHLRRGKRTLKFHLGLLRKSATSKIEVAPFARPTDLWASCHIASTRYRSYCIQKRDCCPQGLRARQHRPSVACVVVRILRKGPSGCSTPCLTTRNWLSKFSHFTLSK